MNKNILLVILLTLITVTYYFPVINLPVSQIDESFILVGAERIMRGEVPHKDFSSEYPEGQFYVLAAFFKMFGTSVATERVYDILIKSLLSLSIFLIIRFLSTSNFALIGWIMSLIWIQHKPAMAYSVYPAMLFIFISVYWSMTHMKEGKKYCIVLSGIFVVIAALFRHDLGGFTAIVISAVLIIRKAKERQSWTPILLFISGAIITTFPVIIYIIIYSDMSATINDLIFVPMAYMEHEGLPYPPLSRWNLPFYVFPVIIVAGTIFSIFLVKRKTGSARAYAILLISLMGVLFFDRIRVRPDTVHLLPVALTGILLSPIILYTLMREITLGPWQRRVIYVLFVIVFVLTLSKPVTVINMILSRSSGYVMRNINPDIERAKYQLITDDIKNVVSYIRMATSNDDYIYVGVKNHDQFVFNDILIYFLSDRNYSSRYHALNPGVQTTLKVQQEIISEFKENPPQVIVLGSRSWNGTNQSGIDSKVDVLDNYISSHFELKKTYGTYEIWM